MKLAQGLVGTPAPASSAMFWLLLLPAQASLFSQPEFLEESQSLLQHQVVRERPGTALLKAAAPFKFMHTPKWPGECISVYDF